MQEMNPNPEASGAALMLRAKQGDESAFRELVERYQDDVIGLCYRYLGNQVDAEEAAQEVFIRLYRSRTSYAPNGKLSTYLYRITVNCCLNTIRNQKRRRWLSFDMLREVHSPSDLNDPESVFEQKERETLIRRMIDSLPKNQKTALLLKRYQELSYEEIADVMGCSVSSVESRLHRARQTLRKKLKPFL